MDKKDGGGSNTALLKCGTQSYNLSNFKENKKEKCFIFTPVGNIHSLYK